jgi:cytosine/adenosine deaminase-related metal-dependent hydrolase
MPVRERSESLLVSGGWLVVEPTTIIARGAVLIRADEIAWTGERRAAPAFDSELSVPAGVIVAGLVNAHAHLDLTLLGGLVPGHEGLLPWLLKLVPLRAKLGRDDVEQGVREGARASLAGGATTVGDIDSFGFARAVLERSGLRAVALREMVGGSAGDADRNAAAGEDWLTRRATSTVVAGLSPHAPYSTHAESYRRAFALAAAHRAVLATHVAESREELQLLEDGTGPFLDLLQRVGAPSFTSPRRRPIAWLRELGVLSPSTTIIHGNYLEASEIECLASSGAGVVYCPRSHAFFGHDSHPVADLLAAGVTVALGTDSLASNQSLSMLEELAFLRRARPDLAPVDLLRMATVNGARALKLPVGDLRPGHGADLIAIQCPGTRSERDVLANLFAGETKLVLAMVAGKPLISDSDHVLARPAR